MAARAIAAAKLRRLYSLYRWDGISDWRSSLTVHEYAEGFFCRFPVLAPAGRALGVSVSPSALSSASSGAVPPASPSPAASPSAVPGPVTGLRGYLLRAHRPAAITAAVKTRMVRIMTAGHCHDMTGVHSPHLSISPDTHWAASSTDAFCAAGFHSAFANSGG